MGGGRELLAVLSVAAALFPAAAGLRCGASVPGRWGPDLPVSQALEQCPGAGASALACEVAAARGALLPLRLKGGRGCTGTRGSVKQRKIRIRHDIQREARRNRPVALSRKPCSGPRALSKLDRFHGTAVIQQVPSSRAPVLRA